MTTLIPMFAVAQPAAKSTLTGLDWIAIALYFGVLLVVAWRAIRKEKETAADYFLAARCFVKGARVSYLDMRVVDFSLGGFSSRHKWASLKEMLRIQRRILKQGWLLCLISALRRVASQTAVQLIVYWGNLRNGTAGSGNDHAARSAESQPQALCGNRRRVARHEQAGSLFTLLLPFRQRCDYFYRHGQKGEKRRPGAQRGQVDSGDRANGGSGN